MWYSHKESGVAVDLNQIRLVMCHPRAQSAPAIAFYFLDGKSQSHSFDSVEQMQEVFDEITKEL